MGSGRCLICCIFLSVCSAAFSLSVSAVTTKHYSFSNGYPTTTTRQPTQATFSSKKTEEKTLIGTVVRVDAGDLIWVTPTGGQRTKVRLDRIDAPELSQAYGVEAKKFLFDLVNGKEVTVHYLKKDRTGAIPGVVFVRHEKGLVEVNLTMLKNGCAWTAESSRPKTDAADTSRAQTYAAAEADARAAKRGLWLAPNPVRPADWRKLHR